MLREIFQKFNNEIVNDKCLEIEENPIVRVTDEQAQRIITKVSKCKNVSEFQKPDAVLKQKYIKKFHESGISIRQISRLYGEKKGSIERQLRRRA